MRVVQKILFLKSVHFKNTVARSSFLSKIVVIFDDTSAEIKTKSDVILKMTTMLKELRIEQLCSNNEQTLVNVSF